MERKAGWSGAERRVGWEVGWCRVGGVERRVGWEVGWCRVEWSGAERRVGWGWEVGWCRVGWRGVVGLRVGAAGANARHQHGELGGEGRALQC